MKPDAYAAGRAVVVAENGKCERASLVWCDHHESRVRKGMSVCDAFVDLLGLMEAVAEAVEPVFRADEREQTIADISEDQLDVWRSEERAVERARLRMQLEALLGEASRERDSAPTAEMRADPYLYGQHMWFGGRVTGIVEALAVLDGAE